MSDGALSQDEIDALLAGVDSSSLGSPAPAPASSGGSENERRDLQNFLASTVEAQSSNLSMLTGAQVTLRGPQVTSSSRDALLQQLPDMVTAIKSDFTGGFPGEHVFLISEDTAKTLASLMNKEENIELDEMALSVISEVMNQVLGTQITALTDKTGNKQVASVSPEAANVPKAVAALPAGDFVSAIYDLNLGDGKSHQIWEVFSQSVVQDIVRALNGGSAAAPDLGAMSGFGGMDMGALGGAPAMGGASSMGGMNMGGMAMPGVGSLGGMGMPSKVQPVQFPSLMSQGASHEQGNIGLIMDVFMEMTVELGRTRKLIKEILGMGEGTIIELDKLAGEPVDILVNHKLIAKGEVVVIDENFGVRVTEIVSTIERMNEMG
ncbi:MAG: flagellar motor switch protein FliN [Treponema sp.]|jgi:flagellar motor switch protein FliN/FliY|nr:flagellar motor switch protein FliN [Treponema sp.]